MKENQDAIERTQELQERLDKLEATPSIVEGREAERKAMIEKRHKAAAEAERIHEDTHKKMTECKEELAEAEAIMGKAKSELEQAEANVRALQAKKFGISNDNTRRANQQREILYSTYDPKIDSEIAFWNDKLAEFRGMKADYQTRAGARNLISWSKELLTYTNRESILKAVLYCQRAIEVLENMKLVPETNQKLIEELRKNVPDPLQYEEVHGERTIEADAADVNALAGLPSDSQLNWEMQKLMEKAEKVKRHSAKPKKARKATTTKAPKATTQKPKAGKRPPLERNDATMNFLHRYWGTPERYR